MLLTIKIMDKENRILCETSGENFTDLVCEREYEEGDHIVIASSKKNAGLRIQLDDAMGDALVYLTGEFSYVIPFGEQRNSYSPKAFTGSTHYLYAEAALPASYRNLALNPYDFEDAACCYPHASANVHTRGEAVFAARNAIDGVRANLSHGNWPYASWGINMRDDACIKIDFGRTVSVDRILLYTRSDFPHDIWWTQVTFHFSDGSTLECPLEKSIAPHVITFPSRSISWLSMDRLIKAEDPSPFPALTQIEIYGTDAPA